MNGTAHALPWPSLALQQKNINRSNMFSGAGEDKRRQSGPGARGAHPTPFFFFCCLSHAAVSKSLQLSKSCLPYPTAENNSKYLDVG